MFEAEKKKGGDKKKNEVPVHCRVALLLPYAPLREGTASLAKGEEGGPSTGGGGGGDASLVKRGSTSTSGGGKGSLARQRERGRTQYCGGGGGMPLKLGSTFK